MFSGQSFETLKTLILGLSVLSRNLPVLKHRPAV